MTAKAYICYCNDGSNRIFLEGFTGRGGCAPEAIEIKLIRCSIFESSFGSLMLKLDSGEVYEQCNLITDCRENETLVLVNKYRVGDVQGRPTGKLIAVAKYNGIV